MITKAESSVFRVVSNYDEIAFDLVSSISSLRTSKLLKSAEFYEEEASASKRKFSINGLAHAADESFADDRDGDVACFRIPLENICLIIGFESRKIMHKISKYRNIPDDIL